MKIEEMKVKGLAFALDKIFNAAPKCKKHNEEMVRTSWGAWLCPKCDEEEYERYLTSD